MVRINKFIAERTDLSRRKAEEAISAKRVWLNGRPAELGEYVAPEDVVTLDGKILPSIRSNVYIAFHKPVGYICSRDGQGSKTIYDLLPEHMKTLKAAGRLDKNTSGLLLLSNDGGWLNTLSHPSKHEKKVYIVRLSRRLEEVDSNRLTSTGIRLDEGIAKFDSLAKLNAVNEYEVTLHQGWNRQIRRMFAAIGYSVMSLTRVRHGEYELGNLRAGKYRTIHPG